MAFRRCWLISRTKPTDFTNKFKPRNERYLFSSSLNRTPVLINTRPRHSNSKRCWKMKTLTTQRPASNRWPRALRRVPQFPAHSPPYQFNRCHTSDLNSLLLNSKAMSIDFPTRARTRLRRVILICCSIPCVDISCCFDCPSLPPPPPPPTSLCPLCPAMPRKMVFCLDLLSSSQVNST